MKNSTRIALSVGIVGAVIGLFINVTSLVLENGIQAENRFWQAASGSAGDKDDDIRNPSMDSLPMSRSKFIQQITSSSELNFDRGEVERSIGLIDLIEGDFYKSIVIRDVARNRLRNNRPKTLFVRPSNNPPSASEMAFDEKKRTNASALFSYLKTEITISPSQSYIAALSAVIDLLESNNQNELVEEGSLILEELLAQVASEVVYTETSEQLLPADRVDTHSKENSVLAGIISFFALPAFYLALLGFSTAILLKLLSPILEHYGEEIRIRVAEKKNPRN